MYHLSSEFEISILVKLRDSKPLQLCAAPVEILVYENLRSYVPPTRPYGL